MPRPVCATVRAALAVTTALLLPASALAQDGHGKPAPAAPDYVAEAEAAFERLLAERPRTGKAKNLILFIGDGMGVSTLTAGRIYQGQRAGQDGVSTVTAIDALPYSALVKTYSHNFQVADSAATATALVAGSKTNQGTINVGPAARLGDCASAAGQSLPSLFELAEDAGKATGVVSTARITHATPAAVYAHTPHRDWENDSELPQGTSCTDIAAQLVAWPHGDGLEVALGGGRANFLPRTAADPEYPQQTGRRADGRDLIAEWRARHPKGHYAWDAAGFAVIDPMGDGPVLGLFEPSHMQFEADRPRDPAGEPALADMVALALGKLARDPDGFVLMVEGGRIDHAHHGGNARRALEDTAAFDAAIAKALSMVDLDETLVVVTADHSHVFTIAGYPPRDASIFGLASVTEDGEPAAARDGKAYTTLGYANGPGAVIEGARANPADQDTEALDYRQQALVPTGSETHGGEDVALKADGPQAHLFRGTIEQHLVARIARHILGL